VTTDGKTGVLAYGIANWNVVNRSRQILSTPSSASAYCWTAWSKATGDIYAIAASGNITEVGVTLGTGSNPPTLVAQTTVRSPYALTDTVIVPSPQTGDLLFAIAPKMGVTQWGLPSQKNINWKALIPFPSDINATSAAGLAAWTGVATSSSSSSSSTGMTGSSWSGSSGTGGNTGNTGGNTGGNIPTGAGYTLGLTLFEDTTNCKGLNTSLDMPTGVGSTGCQADPAIDGAWSLSVCVSSAHWQGIVFGDDKCTTPLFTPLTYQTGTCVQIPNSTLSLWVTCTPVPTPTPTPTTSGTATIGVSFLVFLCAALSIFL